MNPLFEKVALGLLLLLTVSSPAIAADPPQRHYISEGQLRAFCTPDHADEDLAKLSRALCQNYILGIVDGHDAWTGVTKSPHRAFCLPEGTFNAQLTDAVISSLKRKLPTAEGIGAFLVLESLHDNFPCGAGSK